MRLIIAELQIMSNTELLESGKIVVALRTARAAAGWNQGEFADLMGVAKTTVARIETLEMSARAEYLSKAIRLFREAGIEVDLSELDSVPIKVSMLAVAKAVDDLQDVNKRRKDRRTGIASLLPDKEI
jgi:transcriptional regulator with XRE-family HTH domain